MSLLTTMLGSSTGGGGTPSYNGVKTTLNIGTVATGSSVVEWGDGYNHTSVITVNTTLPAIAGGAALAVGKLIYTFPAGAVIATMSYISLAVTQTQGNINANTPYVGLGTLIASGVVANLDGTQGFENVMDGQLAANCTGTASVNSNHNHTDINVGDLHTLYVNAAATWSAGGDSAAILTGTVVINWQFLA